MPAEVIATVHQLGTACKKYKGITFTNKDCNIIRDGDDEAMTPGSIQKLQEWMEMTMKHHKSQECHK